VRTNVLNPERILCSWGLLLCVGFRGALDPESTLSESFEEPAAATSGNTPFDSGEPSLSVLLKVSLYSVLAFFFGSTGRGRTFEDAVLTDASGSVML
jgi:hypothetical protein